MEENKTEEMKNDLVKEILTYHIEHAHEHRLKYSADVIEQLIKERDELRNELCLRCGEYTEAHNGACDGCRWRVNDEIN